jgi:hypothetical protein
MKSLADRLRAIQLGSSRKYDDVVCDITMDGCGSSCTEDACDAMKGGACRGCSRCDFFNKCPEKSGKKLQCGECYLRCSRRADVADWLKDIGGVELTKCDGFKAFDADLPFFVPQVKDTAYGVDHGAYLLSFQRFLHMHDDGMRWYYKKRNFRHSYKISPDAKVLLHFYAKDNLLELIWRLQDMDWGDGKNFWEHIAGYGFDGVVSVNYSCFSNQPRMEHVINIKRNIITAQQLSKVGVPVILDLMFHSDMDRDRLLVWGRDNGVKWYSMNCQTLKKAHWAVDLISTTVDEVLVAHPGAKVLLNGPFDRKRVTTLAKRFGDNIRVSNCAFMKISMGLGYDARSNKWLASDDPKESLWRKTIDLYQSWGNGGK